MEFRMTNGRRVQICPREIECLTETDGGRVFVALKSGYQYHIDMAYADFVAAIRRRPELDEKEPLDA
jgi:hypothetical protein